MQKENQFLNMLLCVFVLELPPGYSILDVRLLHLGLFKSWALGTLILSHRILSLK